MGEAEPALGRRARRSLPETSGEVEPYPRTSGDGQGGASPGCRARRSQSSVVWARSVVAFLPVRNHQRLTVINSSSLGTPVLDPRQGPHPNLHSKPPFLSPGLSAVQGPPPSPPPISQFEKSRIHDKRAMSLPYAHT